jgi:hypothetical protein
MGRSKSRIRPETKLLTTFAGRTGPTPRRPERGEFDNSTPRRERQDKSEPEPRNVIMAIVRKGRARV